MSFDEHMYTFLLKIHWGLEYMRHRLYTFSISRYYQTPFPRWLYQFTVVPAAGKSYSHATSSSALDLSFPFCYSGGCVIMCIVFLICISLITSIHVHWPFLYLFFLNCLFKSFGNFYWVSTFYLVIFKVLFIFW